MGEMAPGSGSRGLNAEEDENHGPDDEAELDEELQLLDQEEFDVPDFRDDLEQGDVHEIDDELPQDTPNVPFEVVGLDPEVTP
jgi:hypothetical protein